MRLAELVAAIREAFERDRRDPRGAGTTSGNRVAAHRAHEPANARCSKLIVVGKLNKQIAAELGAAEKTIKVHRGRVMAKLQVRSVAELVTLTSRIADGRLTTSGRMRRRSTGLSRRGLLTGAAMEKARPFVAVVDDEESVRAALVRLLRASAFECEAFASGQAFLASLAMRRPDCLVLDLQMEGLTGRDVQRQLIGWQIRSR